MKIFAISDLHLALATPGKDMAVFGKHWTDHTDKISRAWKERVNKNDLVLIAGDISWAMKLEKAAADLAFIAEQPGRKVLIRGNHDYWWHSPTKVRACLPEDLFMVHNDAVTLNGVALGGSRLWIDHEMPPFDLPVRKKEVDNRSAESKEVSPQPIADDEEARKRDEKIFQRELIRLDLSLSKMDAGADLKIAMVHFPPLSADFEETRTTRVLEAHGVDYCVFGHLHDLVPSKGKSLLGTRSAIAYHLTSCDYLDFIPALIAEV